MLNACRNKFVKNVVNIHKCLLSKTTFDCLGPQFGLHLTASFMIVIIFFIAFYSCYERINKYKYLFIASDYLAKNKF